MDETVWSYLWTFYSNLLVYGSAFSATTVLFLFLQILVYILVRNSLAFWGLYLNMNSYLYINFRDFGISVKMSLEF
jgi:hypothetical protein